MNAYRLYRVEKGLNEVSGTFLTLGEAKQTKSSRVEVWKSCATAILDVDALETVVVVDDYVIVYRIKKEKIS